MIANLPKNAMLLTETVTVNAASSMTSALGYDCAKHLILKAVHKVDKVAKYPALDILVMELADFSVKIRARQWIEPHRRADVLDSRDKVLIAIKNTLIENGIDLPFPTQQILFHDQTEEIDGDRSSQREAWPAGKETPPLCKIAGAVEKSADAHGQREKDS